MCHTDLGRYHPLFTLSPVRRLLLPTADAGCASVVHAASAVDARRGAFYAPPKTPGGAVEEIARSANAADDALASALWDRTDASWTRGALSRALDAPPKHGAGLFARVPLPGCERGEEI
jgi:hypothetical protein